MTVIVKDYWKSHISAVIYGYCVCGREVQHSAKKIDEKCPLYRKNVQQEDTGC